VGRGEKGVLVVEHLAVEEERVAEDDGGAGAGCFDVDLGHCFLARKQALLF
jgi:hypothetical protein